MLDADLELAAEAALEAGVAVARALERDLRVRYKGPDQPVTVADLAAEEVLRSRLAGSRPDYGWLSEEGTDDPRRLERRRVWVVDPIDGTRSFMGGYPEYAICIALVEDGAVVLGVVHNPATGELYRTVRGGGAWLEERGSGEGVGGRPGRGARRLSVRASESTEPPVLLASRSEIRGGELEPFRGGWRLLPSGSTAYKMARVAAGEADAFLSRGPKKEWDVCAPALLVTEAGGRVTDLKGRKLRYNRPAPDVYGIVASNGAEHDRLLEELARVAPHPRLASLEGDRAS